MKNRTMTVLMAALAGAVLATTAVAQENSKMPPGLEKKGKTPPGLEKQDKTPAGWQKDKKWDADIKSDKPDTNPPVATPAPPASDKTDAIRVRQVKRVRAEQTNAPAQTQPQPELTNKPVKQTQPSERQRRVQPRRQQEN